MRAHELAATRSHSRDDTPGAFVLGPDSAVVMVESADGTTTEVSGLVTHVSMDVLAHAAGVDDDDALP